MKAHFIDTETTGLGTDDEIVSLAIVVWNDGDVQVRYDEQFLPLGEVHPDAAKFNGYTPEVVATLAGKPRFGVSQARTVAQHLQDLEYWAGSNPAFDRRMLERAFARCRVPFFAGHRNIDTCSLAAPLVAFGLVKSASLGALGEYFGLGEQDHTALGDCMRAIAVFERMLELYAGGIVPAIPALTGSEAA